MGVNERYKGDVIMQYGLLSYQYGKYRDVKGCNLGDEIQSIAASCFLPRIDHFIDREEISAFTNNEKVKIIMNGWYMHDVNNWPPSPYIDGLFVSMHFANDKNVNDKIFSSESKRYLSGIGRIGTRDLYTLELLRSHNIPSFFSGCMTLTLPRQKNFKKKDYILCIDVDEKVKNYIKSSVERPVYDFSPELKYPIYNHLAKFGLALNLLQFYQEAHSVVTTRFHVAMPCLALGTPVVLVDKSDGVDGRFWGYDKIVRKINQSDYLKNLDMYNFDNLAPNGEEYLVYRENLISQCENFTGFKHRENLSEVFGYDSGDDKALLRQFDMFSKAMDGISSKSAMHYLHTKDVFRLYVEKKMNGR